MATTSLWKVDKRLDHVIDYATDEEKTKNENVENEGGIFERKEKLLVFNTDHYEKSILYTRFWIINIFIAHRMQQR